MPLEKTKQWFEQAIPEPTMKDACVQVGCAVEETSEFLLGIGDDYASDILEDLSVNYKSKEKEYLIPLSKLTKGQKVQMLDDIMDEIVTRVGIGHCMGFDILGALEEVNRSNFSKLVNGKAVFDRNGKIDKPESYSRPNLEKFV
ncbi:NTP pyrophosphohydrolase-like domain [Vibrio phage 1.016.O._10N.286.46.A11]|nr:NTP pyrophosphohydrolase-like domain [Vibrio phage 1.016.O._10N.286.46.A11]AUR85284.1 NTP pyrophosphohydrolase-like domain [Vibrio phage 1.071.A._10N.286.46.A12]